MRTSLEFLSEMQFLESYPQVYNRSCSVSGVDFLYCAASTQGLGPVSCVISQLIIKVSTTFSILHDTFFSIIHEIHMLKEGNEITMQSRLGILVELEFASWTSVTRAVLSLFSHRHRVGSVEIG